MKQNNLLLFAAIAVFILSVGFFIYEGIENSAYIVHEYNNRDNRVYKLEESFTAFETKLIEYINSGQSDHIEGVREEYDRFQIMFYKVASSILSPTNTNQFIERERLKEVSEGVASIKYYLWGRDLSETGFTRQEVQEFLGQIRLIRSGFLDINFLLHSHGVDSYQGDMDEEGILHIILGVVAMAASSIAFLGLVLQSHRNLEKLGAEKQATIELAETQVRALESAKEGVAILDAEGKYKYVNEAYAEYHGYDEAAELVGRRWYCVYDEETQHWFKTDVFSQVNMEGAWHGEAKGLRKDGTRFPQEVSITALKDRGFVIVVRDISARIEQESLLKSRLAAMEASADGIGLVNKEGKFLYMNKALLDLHGVEARDRNQYIGQDWLNLYNEKGRKNIEEVVLPVVRQTDEWRGEHTVMRKNGEIFWAETALKRLEDGTMVGIIRDVSDRKKSEQEREELQGQLFQAQKMEAIGRLAGGIAHDFNNILAAMMGNAEFLMEDLQDRPEQQKYSEKIYQAGEQAKDLVDQMLAFSRRRDSAYDNVDVIQSVLEAASMLEASLPKTIELKTDIKMASASMLANSTQISQSIMNLCVNAKDAIEGERGQIMLGLKKAEVKDLPVRRYLYSDTDSKEEVPITRIKDIGGKTWAITGFLHNDEEYVHLEVQDSGCGMRKSVMEHIFEPFFTTKPVDKGTGLGLASVHGVVLGHKGAMVVESAEGQGTSFHLFFPLTNQIAEEETQAIEDVAPANENRHYRILVVDDQDDVREMTTQKLQRLGYQAYSSPSGLDAIDFLREHPEQFDLILSDQNMPKMSGIDLAEQVETDFPGLPVILISGYATEKIQEDTKDRTSIKAILKKPVSMKALSQKVRLVLEKHAKAKAA